MSLAFLLPFAGLGVVAGLLTGCVGIGGVLLVPALVYLGGVEVHTAIASSLWVFLFSGPVGTAIYARYGSIDWRMAAWICAGALPTAFLGALVMAATPGFILELLITALVIFSGANALAPRRGSRPQRPLSSGALFVIGALTGFASSLSGTGGALTLVPILVWLRISALTVVGLGQIVSIPVAVAASASNLAGDDLDVVLGTVIAVALVAGVVAGARIAHVLPALALQRAVAGVLILTGLFMLARLAATLLGV